MNKQSYMDLEVWQKAMALVTNISLLTKQFPKEELYSLTNQLRRAAVSVPSNIAEGRSRYSTKDYIRFVMMARGSVAELETQLLISRNLDYITDDELEPIIDNVAEVGRMLSGLFASLEKKLSRPA